RQRAFVQILVAHLVVVFGDVFDRLVAVIFVKLPVDGGTLEGRSHIGTRADKCRIPELLDLEDLKLRAQRFFQPDNHFLFEEVDAPDEVVFSAKGKLQGNGVGSEALPHGADDVVEIRAHFVHLVDDREARDAVLVRLAPDRFRLRLYARHRETVWRQADKYRVPRLAVVNKMDKMGAD